MSGFHSCAVVATAFPADAALLESLLTEAGFTEVLRAADGMQALALVQSRMTDALIADLVLPGLDGVALAARIDALPLAVRPAVLLLTPAGMSVRCTVAMLEKPVSGKSLTAALENLRPEKRAVPAGKRLSAERVLDSVGVPDHCGRKYLLRCVEIAWQDVRWVKALSGKMYPAVAAEYGVSPRHVERAVRHVIDAAWRSGEIEAQYELFGDTIDAKRGCPTCGEMIAQIADILRWEGKA